MTVLVDIPGVGVVEAPQRGPEVLERGRGARIRRATPASRTPRGRGPRSRCARVPCRAA